MKNKLTPLEELRLERCRLKNECTEYEERLQGHFDYAKNNFGRLTVDSVFSSAKSGIDDLFSLVSGKKQTSQNDLGNNKPSSSLATQLFLSAAPFVWTMAKPMIMKMVFKKVTSLFGGGESQKKKEIKKKRKASELD